MRLNTLLTRTFSPQLHKFSRIQNPLPRRPHLSPFYARPRGYRQPSSLELRHAPPLLHVQKLSTHCPSPSPPSGLQHHTRRLASTRHGQAGVPRAVPALAALPGPGAGPLPQTVATDGRRAADAGGRGWRRRTLPARRAGGYTAVCGEDHRQDTARDGVPGEGVQGRGRRGC